MQRRGVALAPSETEQTIALDPELVISGRVTDASTGRPVPAFQLVQGLASPNNPRVIWLMGDKARFIDGRYSIRHTDPQEGYAVRIEAAGYNPADSRVFKPDKGASSFDFVLTRSEPTDLLTGTVVRADGQPAAGVEVALATREHPLLFETEHAGFGRGNGMSFAKTGPDGHFSSRNPTVRTCSPR